MSKKPSPKHELKVQIKKIGCPPARPHPLDPGVVDVVCGRLVAGESIASICADQSMPAETSFYNAMATDTEFGRRIARAREAQQDAECERMVQMADEATPENWQVVRLRIWARQWRASKLAPKKYGEKNVADVNVTQDGQSPEFVEMVRRLNELARQKRMTIEHRSEKGD